jgi:hypothetical protein
MESCMVVRVTAEASAGQPIGLPGAFAWISLIFPPYLALEAVDVGVGLTDAEAEGGVGRGVNVVVGGAVVPGVVDVGAEVVVGAVLLGAVVAVVDGEEEQPAMMTERASRMVRAEISFFIELLFARFFLNLYYIPPLYIHNVRHMWKTPEIGYSNTLRFFVESILLGYEPQSTT